MTDWTRRCGDCGFEWESRLVDCGHEPAKTAGAAATQLRDGLAEILEAMTLMGTATGFDDGGNEPEDHAWREFAEQAEAWLAKMEVLYPELDEEQFNAACLRLERMVGQK